MTRTLSDDELRDLLRHTYVARARPVAPRTARPSIAWSVALVLLGAVTGALASLPRRSAAVRAEAPARDRVEAVQATGSRYAEALSALAAAPPASADSVAIAREVVATSLVGVAQSFIAVAGGTPETIGLYRLASEVRRSAAPSATADRGAAF
jgi:hypothetical protein